MGTDRRPPDDAELAQMRADVDEGMAAGALGISTGLIYPPGAFAETDEVIALAEVVGEHGGIYMSHIRNEAEHSWRPSKKRSQSAARPVCPSRSRTTRHRRVASGARRSTPFAMIEEGARQRHRRHLRRLPLHSGKHDPRRGPWSPREIDADEIIVCLRPRAPGVRGQDAERDRRDARHR